MPSLLAWMRTCPCQSTGSQQLLQQGISSLFRSTIQVGTGGSSLRGERLRKTRPSSCVLCLAGTTYAYVWRIEKTLGETDLAVFGESLFVRVLPSLKLSVISKTLKSIDGETPNPNGCYSELLLLHLTGTKFWCWYWRTHFRRAPTEQFVKLFE